MDTTTPVNPSVWQWLIHHGMAVSDTDGHLVGTVTEVGPTYLTVEWRYHVTAVYYIPTRAIAEVGTREVHLSIPMAEVVNEG